MDIASRRFIMDMHYYALHYDEEQNSGVFPMAYLQSERLICTTNGQAEGKSRLLHSFRRFWKKTVLEELATVYKSGWIITVNDEGQWQLNFRGQVVIFLFDFGSFVLGRGRNI
ncbi:hypothetical protein T02_16210 [Trichinella nativa]|uniref:Uncharacterized protein n=1 Tax=Trichinella nativa TaxID=6335 RepID=A0A0V1KPD0_9BILA|nr:hypothetical protein T02_16210 [Trichinella nativa]